MPNTSSSSLLLVLEDVDAYGLKFFGVSIGLEDNVVYTNGRHFVGLGNYFVTYPRRLQYLEFSSDAGGVTPPLDAWSKDGQVLYVEAGIYYKLSPEYLTELYYTYQGDEWQQVVNAIAAETIRSVATEYDTLAFFTNRSVIDDSMQRQLADRLYAELHFNVTAFNLLAIDVPNYFESAVLDKLIAAQDVLTLERLRDSQLIRSDITVVEAAATANITVINAVANATGLTILKTVEASLLKELAATRAEQLALLAADLGFTSPTEVLQFLYTDVLRGNAAGRSDRVVLDATGAVVGAQ